MRAKLDQQMKDGGLALDDVSIHVEQIIWSRKYWKLARQEGFIFFPIDTVDDGEA